MNKYLAVFCCALAIQVATALPAWQLQIAEEKYQLQVEEDHENENGGHDDPILIADIKPTSVCVTSCTGLPDGDYQSCQGCSVYVSCSNELLTDCRPCAPSGTFWDDNTKTCEYESNSCKGSDTGFCKDEEEEEDNGEAVGVCVSDCADKPNGDYQSCQTCEGFISCSEGYLHNMPCAPQGTFWDDNIKQCQYESDTCKISKARSLSVAAGTCVSSCTGIEDGNYQSCQTCTGYITCSNDYFFDMPCALENTFWDDNFKRCEYKTDTCSLAAPQPEEPTDEEATCVSSCDGVEDGNYQSCQTCSGYITCSNGFLHDMPCAPEGTAWDDETKRCEYDSATCTEEDSSLSLPPKSAEFLMECFMPQGRLRSNDIHDICWLDGKNMVVAQHVAKRLLHVHVDEESGDCEVKIIDDSIYPWRLSCSPEGLVFVTDLGKDVKIYRQEDDGTWQFTVWQPEGITDAAVIGTNDKYIVVLPQLNPGYVYSGEKHNLGTKLYQVKASEIEIKQTYFAFLTKDNTLLTTTGYDEHNLYIWNVEGRQNSKKGGFGSQDGQFNHPAGVTASASGHILVCDYRNNRVSVFTPKGQFLHNVEFAEGAFDRPWNIAMTPESATERRIAVVPGQFMLKDANRIRIYSFTT